MTCFLQFLFVNIPTISSPLRSLITYVQGTLLLTFLIPKTSTDKFGVYFFCRNAFMFQYSYMITNFKFRSFIVFFFIIVNICVWVYVNSFQFDCVMICIIVFKQCIVLFQLHQLIYQYTSFLVITSYICKFCSLRL